MNVHRRIRLLPPVLQNQIAAGEVVDRPSGVLRELLENSLDAGSSHISVTLEDGGQTLIAVRDDGSGIPAGDLALAVTAHATSKVANFDELLRVTSYGFRGEALPSVASVASLRVESAWNPDPSVEEKACDGAFIEVSHGATPVTGPSSIRRGTLVEVRDLFANVPARLKFLKTPATELKRCLETVSRLALARLDVSFAVLAGEREALRFAAGADLRTRLARIWPPQVAAELLPFDGSREGIRVQGLASLPEGAQARGDRILLYVNRRPVNDRLLQGAIREAYKGRLTSREYPQVVLFLDMDPASVDMNVHPAKTEVRFRDERAVFAAVLRALQSCLSGQDPDATGDVPHMHERGSLQRELPPLYAVTSQEDSGGALPLRAASGLPLPQPRPDGFWGTLDHPRVMDFPQRDEGEEPRLSTTRYGSPVITPGVAEAAAPYIPETSSGMAAEQPVPSLRGEPFFSGQTAASPAGHGYPILVGDLLCLGQVADSYLILVQGDALLLLDQHAAHERVLLHSLSRENACGECRLLMLSVDMALHPAEGERLQERYGDLVRLGYSLETEGPDRLRIRGLPALLSREQGIALLRDILADKTDGMDDLLHLMACRAAIKAGDRLTGDEAAGLLTHWLETPERRFCPHGRPVVLRFGSRELEKMFKRTVG